MPRDHLATVDTPAPPDPGVSFYVDAPRLVDRRARMGLPGRNPQAPKLLVPPDAAWHLARRCAHAATARLAETIATVGAPAWLEAQLAPGSIDDSACQSFVATTFPLSLMSSAEVRATTNAQPWLAPPSVARATLWRQLSTTRPLFETVVEMWHDQLHIALFSDKVSSYIGAYDREAIRANAFGRFADLLYAALTHPAMLLYLDNHGSTKTHPDENLARELLELHTVGFGNYTEADVKAASLLLTGFGVDTTAGVFKYRSTQHAVGPVTILGRTYANPAADQATATATLRSLTDALARHPATVRQLAHRLIRRYVADDPPAMLVSRLTTAYLANDTAMVPVLRTLFTSPEFQASVGNKWRRPQEHLAAMLSAGQPRYVPPTATDVYAPLGTSAWLLEKAGHLPLAHPTPEGPSDKAGSWSHTGALLTRWNLAEAVAARWDDTLALTPWASALGLSTALTYTAAATRIVVRLTGITPATADRDALAAFLADQGSPTADLATRTVHPDHLKWRLDETVRLAMSSPYASIR